MALLSISHKRCECIGCGLCVETAPDYWFMNPDGEAELQTIHRKHAKFEFAEALPQDLNRLLEAAEGCPVNIIRVG